MTETNYEAAMTKVGASGEMPLPRRQGARTVLPLSWLGREISLSYTNNHGHGSEAKGTLLDWTPVGILMTVQGSKTLVSFDRVVSLVLAND
jgi:hypothetical protein